MPGEAPQLCRDGGPPSSVACIVARIPLAPATTSHDYRPAPPIDLRSANVPETTLRREPAGSIRTNAAASAAVGAAVLLRALAPAPGPGDTGIPVLLANAADLAASAAFFATACALGLRALRAASVPVRSPLEGTVLATAAGSALLGTSLLVIGWTGLAAPVVLWGFCVAAIALATPALAAAGTMARAAAAQLRRDAGGPALAVGAAFVAFMLITALAPPTDWDSLMYHLQVPAVLLRAGPAAAAANPHAAFVGPVQSLYLPFLAAGSSAGPALLSVGHAALFAAAVVLVAARLGRGTARTALLLLWGSFAICVVAVTPRIDVTLALYLLLAHHLFLPADEGADGRRLVLGAALIGYAVGIKYHAAVYGLVLLPLAAADVARLEPGARVRCVAAGCAAAAVAAAPALLKNFAFFGDPLYPFLRGPRTEPWLAGLGPRAAAGTGLDVFSVYSRATRPFDVVAWFRNPAPLSPEAEGFLYRANAAFLLLPLVLLCRRRSVLWLVLPAAAYMALVVLVEPSGNLRYLLPVAAPFTVGVAWAVERLAGWLSRRSPAHDRDGRSLAGRAVVVAVATVSLLLPAAAVVGLLGRGDQLAWDAGAISRERYLAGQMRPLGALLPHLDAAIPDNARLLLLYEARGFWLPGRPLEDNYGSAWARLDERLGAGGCVDARTADYVLVDWMAEGVWLDRGVPAPVLRPDRLRDFTRRCLRPVFEGEDYSLYRVPSEAETSERSR